MQNFNEGDLIVLKLGRIAVVRRITYRGYDERSQRQIVSHYQVRYSDEQGVIHDLDHVGPEEIKGSHEELSFPVHCTLDN